MKEEFWEEICDRIDGYWDLVDDTSYAERHPLEAIECSRNGEMIDLDWMVHLSELLKMPISWELYHYIDGHYDDSLMDLDESDLWWLEELVRRYVNKEETETMFGYSQEKGTVVEYELTANN